jgi:hypothetical protein
VTDAITIDEGDGVAVERAGRWTYHWRAPEKPFFHPVTTPAGHVLTRAGTTSHPWHHGLWFTIKFVNGENFWEEIEPFGTLHHAAVPTVDGPTLAGPVRWVRPDGTVIVEEQRRLTHVDLAADAYALDVRLELTASADVELDRTPYVGWGGYSGLTYRGRDDLDATFLLDGDTGRGREAVTGDRGRWLDLSGRIGGAAGAPVGIAMFDGPGNPNHPTPWYGHTDGAVYGEDGHTNFLNAAFLWDGPVVLAAGKTLTFDHRVLVHDGVWDAGRLEAEYASWAPRRT